ncbi:MAG: hypothetical protein KBC30_05365 [Planctomycetes bacterium]|nr:hypothetical protein [Planctomycetota bacterium]
MYSYSYYFIYVLWGEKLLLERECNSGRVAANINISWRGNVTLGRKKICEKG